MDKLSYLRQLANTDFQAACQWAEQNIESLPSFFETWARHCGAPRETFIGHTVRMLADSRMDDNANQANHKL